MKTLIAVMTIALLAGCGQMGMHKRDNATGMQSGSSTQMPSSGAYGPAQSERDDFHSWIN